MDQIYYQNNSLWKIEVAFKFMKDGSPIVAKKNENQK